MSIAVLLVDDHAMLRGGLRSVLEKEADIEVVGEVGDGRTALALAADLDPDVVVMDIGMPDLNGVDATRLLLEANPELKVIALSMHDDKRYVLAMLKAGAKAYLIKNAATRELVRAIRAVAAGQSFLSPGVAAVAVQHIAADPSLAPRGGFEELSNREREVLQLVSEGKTSKQVAAVLHLSSKTVETHRRKIMRKLDLHSVAELTRYAIREGISFVGS